MSKILKDGPEWRKEQCTSFITRHWAELDEDDIDRIAQDIKYDGKLETAEQYIKHFEEMDD